MKTYRCPVCGKPLTLQEYESALGIIEKREAHLKHREDDLEQREKQFLKQKADLLAKARKAKEEGKKEGRQKEKERAERLMQGQQERIKKLQERISQLEKGTTPQVEGLAFEKELVAHLQSEFPDDEVIHEGKGGDVLHFVVFENKRAGVIIYECKRTPDIPSAHIQQASCAKQTREADFAILVTTGRRKGFGGLAESNGVLIVSPGGVISLVSLLRVHLIEMLKTQISKEQKAKVAQQLLKYITSPQFKNPIEEVITRTNELEDMLKHEAKQHWTMWETRWAHYQRIKWDASQIQCNIQLALHGKETKPLTYPKPESLRLLPASKSQ